MELTHSHLGLLTRHLGHLKSPRTFLTRHLLSMDTSSPVTQKAASNNKQLS